jgi:hypothetical protein
LFFCHFLLAQKVTKKGTTKTNHLLVLVAQGYTPGLAELVVRTFRGHPRAPTATTTTTTTTTINITASANRPF